MNILKIENRKVGMNKWHDGLPPEIGWWPASLYKDEETLRWWDGAFWSYPCGVSETAKTAGFVATLKSIKYTPIIKWTNRWWEGV